VSLEVHSTRTLAAKVAEGVPPGTAVTPVPELVGLTSVPGDSLDLLQWVGWMTAGPPSLPAGVLRSAGRWALIRYRWALEDRGASIAPTIHARATRRHTRSTFSEAIGVGAGGNLSCLRLAPLGHLAVVNLDDAIDPLLRSGLLRRSLGSKQPDYLVISHLTGGRAAELLAVECKGTVKTEAFAIEQLRAGVIQTIAIEAALPMRRIVFATSLELDSEAPRVRCHAVEVRPEAPPAPTEIDPEAASEALLDAALIRSLRCAGRYDLAEQVRQGSEERDVQIEPDFEIGGRPMAGERAELEVEGVRLVAQVGIDQRVLEALAAPRRERRERLAPTVVPSPSEGVRRRAVTPDAVVQETVMRDGVGIRFEMHGRHERQEIFF